jgi:hypothetical protein
MENDSRFPAEGIEKRLQKVGTLTTWSCAGRSAASNVKLSLCESSVVKKDHPQEAWAYEPLQIILSAGTE